MTTIPTSSSPFFTSPTPSSAPTTPPAPPSTFSNVVGGLKSFFFTPARVAAEETVQGVANRTAQLFDTHQAEFTQRISKVFSDALLRRTPESFHLLLHHLQAFLKNPSKVDLDRINLLLNGLTEAQIQSLCPTIRPEGITQLTTLKACLDREIVEIPATNSGHQPSLNISTAAEDRLKVAAEIIKAIIESHEGALFQVINTLTFSMSAADGPVAALKEQLNHPQNGILAQSLGTLRTQLTSRANPQLREAKNAFDTYISALSRNANSSELIPPIQVLQSKLIPLQSQHELVPQLRDDQWHLINQYQNALAGFIANPASLPTKAQLLTEAQTINTCISFAFNAQRGMVEEAADILVEGIGRGVEHLVPIPGRMLQGVLSPQSGTSTPLPSFPSVTTSSHPSTLNVGQVVTQGQGLLSTILSSAGNNAAQMAAKSLATLVSWTFEKIRDHVAQNGEHLHLLDTINPLITRLNTPSVQSSWTDLTGILQQAFQFMQDQQVYLQGLRLPLNSVRNHTSAIPSFLNNINSHQNILQHPSQRTPERVTSEMIEKQASFLKARSTTYGPALFIAEKFCGLQTSPAFYADIFKSSSEPSQTDLKAVFRQRLFDKIDASNIHFIRKWFAKRVYDLCTFFSTFYVDSMLENILKMATDSIQPSPIGQPPKDEMMVKLIRNWMAVMSGAYNHVANSPPSQSEDFGTMMEKALKLPERNGGLTQQELYSAVVKTALDTFGPNIAWSETIDRYFSAQIPSDSSFYFLNPVVKALSSFSNYCLQAVVFIPQWIGNQAIKSGAKLAISYSPFLKDYAEKAIDSLRRNTPSSYSAQRMIYTQLQKVLATLQTNLSRNDAVVANRNTNIKTVEIESLVRYALEILNKGQYRTQDSLRDYLNGRDPLRHRAEHELENTFLPEAIGTAVKLISESLHAMTKEEEMKEMLYSGLKMANEMFNETEPVSDEDFAAIEKGIRELNAQILETAVFHAIGEKFDFTNEKQKNGIAQFMTTLKEQTHTFFTELHQHAREIEHGSRLSNEALRGKIISMIEVSSKYNKERVDTQSLADGNPNFHTETKYHFNELSRQLATRCSTLADRLNTMKSQSDEMLFYEKLIQPLLLSQQIQTSMEERLQTSPLSSDAIQYCKIQLSLLKQHLLTLRQNRCPASLEQNIQRTCDEFSTSLDALETLHQTQQVLRQAGPLFTELKERKIAGIGQPSTAELKRAEKELCELLNKLPSPEQKAQLKQSINSLMIATNRDAVSSTVGRFNSLHQGLCTRATFEMNTRLELFHRNRQAFQTLLDQSIQDYSHRYAESKNGIQRHARESAVEVQAIETWTQAQHNLPIWNIFAFDMQWVTDTITNIAFDRAKMKTQLLFDALYQKHNYVGFINQVALMPFLKTFGKHHLKMS